MKKSVWLWTTTAALAATSALVHAQPAPNDPRPGDPYAVPAAAGQGSAAGSGIAAPAGSDDDQMTDADRARMHRDEQAPIPVAVVPIAPRPPDPPIDMPELLRSPTGWILPAAVIYSKTSIDTGGGVSTNARVGLGDVAEFGIATTDDVRARPLPSSENTQRIQPYALATFRMGVAEHRLFDWQPGLALGFDKSFERNDDGFKTRTAQLSLVASKHFGARTAFHVGGAFWDASLAGSLPDGTGVDTSLHAEGVGKQIRPFGGIQVMPIDKSEILVDLSWAPEFCPACATNSRIQLRPELSWGVRYQVADWMHLESGVRVPDIGNANLLNAQIFGSVTFTSWVLHHAVQSLK